MKITRYLPILLFLLAQLSCSDMGDCFKGSGAMTAEYRELDPIKRIDLRTNVDLIIHPDTFYRVLVRAEGNLIDEIETSRKDSTLYIRNNNRCNWVRKFNPELVVEVWVKELNNIFVESSDGNIYFSDTLDSYIFRFDSYDSQGKFHLKLNSFIATLAMHTGPSDMKAEGIALVQYNYSAGFGKMECLGLKSEKIYMNNKGTNDVYVRSSEVIEAKIESQGNIFYTGDPVSVKAELLGSGKIIKL